MHPGIGLKHCGLHFSSYKVCFTVHSSFLPRIPVEEVTLSVSTPIYIDSPFTSVYAAKSLFNTEICHQIVYRLIDLTQTVSLCGL